MELDANPTMGNQRFQGGKNQFQEQRKPNQTKPNQTKPNKTKTKTKGQFEEQRNPNQTKPNKTKQNQNQRVQSGDVWRITLFLPKPHYLAAHMLQSQLCYGLFQAVFSDKTET